MLPTSRDTITVRDSDANCDPVVDPNYLATEVDRHVMSEGLRKIPHVLRDTSSGLETIAEETVEEDRQTKRVGRVGTASCSVSFSLLLCPFNSGNKSKLIHQPGLCFTQPAVP